VSKGYEMAELTPKTTKKVNPPIGAVEWYDKFFKLLDRIKIDKIDKEFLVDKVVPSSNVYKVIGGLKFLGLINKDGSATDRMKSLNVVGADFQKNLEKTVRDAYTSLFERIKNLEQALPEDVINFFRGEYDMSPNTAKQSAKIFVFLAQKSGINLSQSIVDKLGIDLERKKPGIIERKPRETRQKSQLLGVGAKEELLSEEALGRFILKGAGYVDIKDRDTFEIAKAYLKLLAKKLGITEESGD
jgi:hypothetical protein